MEPTFPIVAIGASAGGLAPTTELLRGLGAAPGSAIVVIHPLDPTHESGLVDILSRATTMPVAAASDGAAVESNHVYVVPPNAGLLIGQGRLKLVPRPEAGGLHLPIDRFFESLALEKAGVEVVGEAANGHEAGKSKPTRAISSRGKNCVSLRGRKPGSRTP